MITSVRNEHIRAIAELRETKVRRDRGQILIEGAREIARATQRQVSLVEIVFCADFLNANSRELLEILRQTNIAATEVAAHVFEKIALRERVDGIVAVAKRPDTSLAKLTASLSAGGTTTPCWIAVEAVEKPGNLGAIIRSTDGAGTSAVVVLDPAVDVFSPNVIRASIGACFHATVVECTADDLLQLARKHNMQILGAALSPTAVDYSKVDMRPPTLILLGSEAHGLSPFWLESCDQLICLPMRGIGDSLNVSVTAGILAYEVSRQRQPRG